MELKCREKELPVQIRSKPVIASGVFLATLVIGACIGLVMLFKTDDTQTAADKTDIPGNYQSDYSGVVEFFALGNGTYNETYVSPVGDIYRNSGQWSYSTTDGESYVLLQDTFLGSLDKPPIRSNKTLKAMRYSRNSDRGSNIWVTLESPASERAVNLRKPPIWSPKPQAK